MSDYVEAKPGGLFSFEGCCNRAQWWKTMVAVFFLGIMFFTINVAFFYISIIKIIMLGLWLPVAWIALATAVKRFHDLNMSGWFWLLNLIPLIGPLIVFVMHGFIKGKQYSKRYDRSSYLT